MAVLKNGRLVGRVGNLVYRDVKGRTIVQSRPRRSKRGFQLTSRNSNFSVASMAASALYRELKDFALNLSTRELYNSIVSLLMGNPEVLQPEGPDNDWSLVPDSHLLPVEKKRSLPGLQNGAVGLDFADGTYRVQIPPLNTSQIADSIHHVWKNVQEYERTFTLLYYDFETTSASVVGRWTSRRTKKGAKSKAVLIERELIDGDGFTISRGLLVLAVGLRLYAAPSSSSYLNRPDYNPFVVTGIWKKH